MKSRSLCLALLAALALTLSLGADPASADRALLNEAFLLSGPPPLPGPPPEGEIEGACGLALAPGGNLYVSDYYHRVVDLFSGQGDYQSQIVLPGSNPVQGINTLDAVCGLALDSGGNLYANELHQGVLRLRPTEATIDSGDSTGVAVDAAGNLYVNDRTYVAEYQAPVKAGDAPAAVIGLGNLGDAYGLAVSPSGARVYVPDAATNTVKVFEPATSLTSPVAAINPGFGSLVNAALAVDPTNEHLLVVDNLQSGYEHPASAVDEFSAAGAFLGPLPGAPVDGEPSGIAVDPASGTLFVTSGNDEGSNVFVYGPYSASLAPASLPAPGAPSRRRQPRFQTPPRLRLQLGAIPLARPRPRPPRSSSATGFGSRSTASSPRPRSRAAAPSGCTFRSTLRSPPAMATRRRNCARSRSRSTATATSNRAVCRSAAYPRSSPRATRAPSPRVAPRWSAREASPPTSSCPSNRPSPRSARSSPSTAFSTAAR